MSNKSKKRDPQFEELLRKTTSVDESGNLKVDGMYASTFVNFGFGGGIVSAPVSHVVFFLTHGRWPDSDKHVDHRDDNPMNNAPSNLQELTHAENQRKRRGRKVYPSYGKGKYGGGMCVRQDNRDGRYYVTYQASRGLGAGDLKNVKVGLGGFSTLEAAEERARECLEDIKAGREFTKLQADRRRPDAELMRELRTQGLTLAAIAEQTGFSEATIYNVTKDIELNPVRGESQVGAKLTDEKVREARKLRAEGMAWRPLAARYGVAVNAIVNAVNGKTWRHVT